MAKNGNGGDTGCLAVILGLVLWVGFDRIQKSLESLEQAVRGDAATGAAPTGEAPADLAAELERLRLENAALRERIDALEAR